LFDAIGAALWSGVAIAVGYVFRDAVNDVLDVFAAMGKIGLTLIVLALVVYVAGKWVQRQRFIRQLRMDRVTVEELRALAEAEGGVTVIDVRSPLSQTATGRIPGALTVDAANMKVELLAIEPRSEVVVYCACPNEASAVKVATALVQHGFKRVRPLAGGIDAWIAAGYEVER
jgi:rhodanese-related sulfurtransferase